MAERVLGVEPKGSLVLLWGDFFANSCLTIPNIETLNPKHSTISVLWTLLGG